MHGFEVLGFTGSRVRILAHPPTLADQIEASYGETSTKPPFGPRRRAQRTRVTPPD
jgi:hypothetical protein